MKRYLLLLTFLFSITHVFSQFKQLSPDAEISLLTISPGTNLNDSFGHSSFRVKSSDFDIVFNYGIYDFKTPNFYTKFAQGKLNYKVETAPYEPFKDWYVGQNRGIVEQVLNLTQEEKQNTFNYLANNAQPENMFYLYDFFYDNCATKMWDVLDFSLDEALHLNTIPNYQPKSFRTLIQDHLHWNSWGSLGIDVALGSIIDIKATPKETMFLPQYVHDYFKSATLKTTPEKQLVKTQRVIYKPKDTASSHSFLSSPFFIFSILSLIIIYITYKDFKNNRRTKWIDILLFAVTGLIGVGLLLLWFATDHQATAFNYNILWAFGINLFVIGQVFKTVPKKWFTKYIKFLIIMLVLMTFHWTVGVQVFALALLPLLLALAIRYVYLVKHFKTLTA